MLYSYSPAEIAEKLIGEAKPAEALAASDKQLLLWNKRQALGKMPIEIRPQGDVKAETVDKMKGVFTSMISMVNEKAYKYEKNNADSMSKIFKEFGSTLLKTRNEDRVQNEGADQFRTQEQGGEQALPEGAGERIRTQSHDRSMQSGFLRGDPARVFAPFVSKSENPCDRNANSKLVNNRNVNFDGKMRNIAAIIEKNKKINHFKTQNTFMRPASQAKRDPKVDINDILRYTLGEKRLRDTGFKPEPVRNPFVRVPAKYSQALNDFYT